MSDHEKFADWDASYVLGALTPNDRQLFEGHLIDCPQCKAAVADLAPIPGLLSRIEGLDAITEPEAPAGLLERTQHLARRRRRMRGLRLAAAAAVGALVAALVIFVPSVLSRSEPEVAVSLQPVVTTAMSADVTLDAVPWGTSITIECSYPHDDAAYTNPASYALMLVDADGNRTEVSSWHAVDDATATVSGATAMSIADIDSLVVVNEAGDDVFTADVMS